MNCIYNIEGTDSSKLKMMYKNYQYAELKKWKKIFLI